MNRFKEGDVVVCISESSYRELSSPAKVGDKFIVNRTFIGNISNVPKFATENNTHHFREEDFELDAIVGTPLYEALK